MLKKIVFCALLIACSSVLATTPNKPVLKKKPVGKEIEVPAELDRNYDELLNSWAKNGKIIDCDYNGQSTVLCDDSTYIKRLYALPTKMELAYNDAVKRFIEMYADRRRGQVSYMLGQGTYYFPMFEEALNREGLPLELKYLPVIESALNPIARSRVGATGLWQFMPATGKLYKLEINSLIDERRDPYKSTQAAVQYLKDMYAIYGDWNLVIAAYNCGPGNVNKAIRRSGGKKDYWEIYPYLPRETRGYVPAFIAATYIMSYYKEHNICPAVAELPALVDTLGVNKMVHFEQIADVLNVPIEKIRKLNPQFTEDIIPGEYKEYALRLPIYNLTSFIEHADTIYAHRKDELFTHKRVRNIASGGNAPASGGYAMHRVKRGETLGAVAMRYRVSIAQLKRWNNMKSDRLAIGQNLKVSDYIAPKKEVRANVAPKEKREEVSKLIAKDGVLKKVVKTTRTSTENYKVKKGDTWNAISKKTGASIADIKKWNGIKNNKLMAGKNLKILTVEEVETFVDVPKPEEEKISIGTASLTTVLDSYVENIETVEPDLDLTVLGFEENEIVEEEDEESATVLHEVIYGETISQIAARYNVSVEDILTWNNIAPESKSKLTKLLIILPKQGLESQMMNGQS